MAEPDPASRRRPGPVRPGRRAFWAGALLLFAVVAIGLPAVTAGRGQDTADPPPTTTGASVAPIPDTAAEQGAGHAHQAPVGQANMTLTWFAALLVLGLVAMLIRRPPPRPADGAARWRYVDTGGQDRNREDA